jgi:hypothetical protein
MTDNELNWMHSLTPEQVRRELDARQIDTKNAVSHVLAMVREVKRKEAERRAERN